MTWRSMSLYKRVATLLVCALIGITVVLFFLRPKPDKLVGYVYGVESSVFAFDGKRGGTSYISVTLDNGTPITVSLPPGIQNQPRARVKLGIYTVTGGGPQERVLKFESYVPVVP